MDHIARHAEAEQDPFAALANLLAHEIAINSFSFMDMLQIGSCDSEECQQLKGVLRKVLARDKAKDKQTGLFRKTAAGNALAAGAGPDEVNRQLGWKVPLRAGLMLYTIQGHMLMCKQCWQDLTNTAGDRTTTWQELQQLLVNHGVMPCYQGFLPAQT
jgi:hypothetical protein